MTERIRVVGAQTHNLKNVSVEIPRHSVVVFTGVSGSGKSSLVFDTIYTEAQRQLIETFSCFARRCRSLLGLGSLRNDCRSAPCMWRTCME